MAVAFVPVPLAPTTIMQEQHVNGGQRRALQPSLNQSAPSSHEPSPVPRRTDSSSSYLATTLPDQQPRSSNHPYLERHAHDLYDTPPPQSHGWQPQPLAGPSTYNRRLSNESSSNNTMAPTPAMSQNPYARTKTKGRMTAPGEQMVVSMERMVVSEGDGRVGVGDPFGERSYTELKCLGDGSFGTVWLCDWHSPVKSDVMLSAMQCGAGARPEWAGKRLVALKRMKRVWEGGWSQARNLGEIYSLSRIPTHPAIIPLYDAFISPKSRELYFVFECMEGNLYQLTKSRRGRPLASGLIASCFHQITSGLDHIHRHGYFHRDMKPENLLVTTTGLTNYLTSAALAQINARGSAAADEPLYGANGQEVPRYQKDVSVIVKLADFGLARATSSKPPYTEYVSTRWYRAPEVLLRSTDYGPPVDMWALGTILTEMLNLKPLFPGISEIDQVFRICEVLGDPTDYGTDERGRMVGGSSWVSGNKLAKKVGFSFPKRRPIRFGTLFNDTVPQSLIDCIADLLRYDPQYRLTSAQCLQHPYFHETLPHLQQTLTLPRIPFAQGQPAHPTRPTIPAKPDLSAPPRVLPPSHSNNHEPRPVFANGDMRTLPPPVGTPDNSSRVIFPSHTESDRHGPSALVNQLRELDLPTEDLHSYGNRPPPSAAVSQQMAPHTQTWAQEPTSSHGSPHPSQTPEAAASTSSFTQFSLSQHGAQQMPSTLKVASFVQAQQHVQNYEERAPPPIEPTPNASTLHVPMPSTGKVSSLTSGKKKKWGLSSVFGGGDKSTTHLAPVEEVYTSPSSLKRTQSGSYSQERLDIADLSDPKLSKKEAEKAKREAERMKREAAAMMQRERARAVMSKRQNMVQDRAQVQNPLVEYSSGINAAPNSGRSGSNLYPTPSGAVAGSVRDLHSVAHLGGARSATSIHTHESEHSKHSVYSGQSQSQPALPTFEKARHKARRRDDDDDHSMSSLDHNSLRSRSVLTVGTIDSDPGPRVGRHDREPLPRTFTKDPLLTRRAPSLTSFHQQQHSSSRLASLSNPSLESQLANDFQARANVASPPSSALGQAHPALTHAGFGMPASQPTSPYGNATGAAVSQGVGMGRSVAGSSQVVLPSIRTLEEAQRDGVINPMFKVVSGVSNPSLSGSQYSGGPLGSRPR